MKRSERRVSFGCIQSADLKPFTSAAMRVGNADASNFVMGPTPLTPARTFSQAWATVFPTGETRPSPVTTTLRFDMVGGATRYGSRELRGRIPEGLLLDVAFDVIDRLLHVSDLLGFLVGDLALELFLERHHELHVVQ